MTCCLTVVAERFDLLHTGGDLSARVESQVTQHLPQVLDLLLQGLVVVGSVHHRRGTDLNPQRELEPVSGTQEQHYQDENAEEHKHKRFPEDRDLVEEICEHQAQRPSNPEYEELIMCPTC